MAKKEKPSHIHDHFFKHYFGHIEIARDFLTQYLSQAMLRSIDLSTLQAAPKEYQPSHYRSQRNVDLLFTAKQTSGKEMLFFLHLEHQSRHQKNMACRLWEYHAAIGKKLLDHGAPKIPPIISFVLYHGTEEWTSPTAIADLFEDVDTYIQEGLQRTFLINITKSSVEKLSQHGLVAPGELVLRQQSRKDMVPILGEVLPRIKKGKLAECCQAEIVEYMIKNDKREELEFIQEMSKFDSELYHKYKHMFDRAKKRFYAEGEQQGMRKGIQVGRSEGIQKGIQVGINKAIAKFAAKFNISMQEAKKIVTN